MNCDKSKNVYDVIIVGAGTAGAVAAKRITDSNRCLSVLVLEAGTNENENPMSKTPFVFQPELGTIGLFAGAVNPKTSDVLVNDQFQGSNFDPQIYDFHGGRGWGGASNHNYLFAIRPSPQYADEVGKIAGPAWNSTRFNEILKEMETYNGPSNPNRGTEGPWHIAQVGPVQNITNILLQEMKNQSPEDAGVPIALDYNANVNRILTPLSQNFLENDYFTRTHAGTAFLGPDVVNQHTGRGKKCRRLNIVSNAFVNKVLFCHKKAKAVEVVVNGKTVIYKARKRIILSAGAMRTPGILERSGVGDFNLLSKLGVRDLVYNNDQVGENFQNHVGPSAIYTVNPDLYEGGPNALFNGLMKLLPGTTPNGQDRRIQILTSAGLGIPGNGQNNALFTALDVPLDGSNTYSSNGWNLQPTSRGSIHIVNPNPETNPSIKPNFLSTDEDKEIARASLKLMKRVEQNIDPNVQFDLKYPPPSAFASDELLDQYAASLLSITDHMAGTASLGTVVDEKLFVKGVRNLMVADNSVWPIIPDCNTALSAALVGWMAADFVTDDFE